MSTVLNVEEVQVGVDQTTELRNQAMAKWEREKLRRELEERKQVAEMLAPVALVDF